MPPRRIHDHQVPIEGVTGAWIATQGVAGTKNTMANVNEADATVVANGDVIEGVAVTVTSTATKIVKVGTAVMATIIRTVVMRITTVAQEDRALSGMMISLLCGLQPHHPGLPSGAQVLHTMTTLGDRPPRHYYLKMTDREGQTHHLRMVPLGVSRKTCTEGTDGWTVGSTILNGKLALCIRLSETLIGCFSSRRRQQRVNSTFSIWPPSPPAPARDLCVFSILLKYTISNLLPLDHWSETENHAKSINVTVPPLFLLQQIVKVIGGVVKEKNASERGGKRTGESGDIDVHKLIRMKRTVSVIVMAGGNGADQKAENVAKLSRERKAHPLSSQVMKMSGWKNLLPLAPLSPLFLLLFRP
jgi:hypothetical protein